MKLYKTKLGRIINFIKNENKFVFGSQVKVLKNTVTDYPKYDKYIGQYGIIVNIDYSKKEYMFEVKFADGNKLGFNEDELHKITDDEYFNNYKEYKEIFNKIII